MVAIPTSGAAGYIDEPREYLDWLEKHEQHLIEQLAENIVDNRMLSALLVWALDEDHEWRGIDTVQFNKTNARTAFMQAMFTEAKEAARQVKEFHNDSPV